jgi:hypothetical protein
LVTVVPKRFNFAAFSQGLLCLYVMSIFYSLVTRHQLILYISLLKDTGKMKKKQFYGLALRFTAAISEVTTAFRAKPSLCIVADDLDTSSLPLIALKCLLKLFKGHWSL